MDEGAIVVPGKNPKRLANGKVNINAKGERKIG